MSRAVSSTLGPRRVMELTEELVALVERIEPDPGPEAGTVEHSPSDFSLMARELLNARPGGPVWLFAYGSLIWNPEFEPEEVIPAVARGWHRSFCMKLTRWRGTRELPALMLALDRGGTCSGIAYRLDEALLQGQIIKLLEREIDGNPPTNVPRWITIETSRGSAKALAFVADRNGPAYAGRVPLEEVARVVATAAGHWGSSAHYAYRTIAKLEVSGIHDRNLWRLQKLVAAEITRHLQAS